MRLTVNWRFLLKVAVVFVVAGVAVHFAHRWQVRKQVDVYLRHADTARDAGERERELNFLRRYLAVRPNDIDTRERLARAMCRAAKSGRQLMEAYLVVEDVLRRDPARDDLRRFAVDTAMDSRLGLFPEARGHIDALLQKRPADRELGELEGLYALCLAREGKYKTEGDTLGAADWYAKSIGHHPNLIESYAGRAAVLRLHLKREDEAHQVIAAMVDANTTNFRAHVFVAGYWRAFDKPQQAAAMIAEPVAKSQKLPATASVADAVVAAVAEATKYGPQELDVILLAADVARVRARSLARANKDEDSQKAIAEARQLLTRGTELHPKSVAVYLATASLTADTGSAADAAAVIRKGVEAVPDAPGLVLALLDYQIRAGDAAGASETLDKLKVGGLSPVLADYEQARILALQEKWLDATVRLEAALAELREAARRDVGNDPGLARRLNLLLGRCYAQVGEDDRRLEAYVRAVPDDLSDPLWAPALIGVAEAQATLGRADDALATYRRLGAWIPVAQFELLRALRSPAEKRNLAPVREALVAADKDYAGKPADRVPTELHLLRADLLNFENKAGEARTKVEALRAARPKEVAVWIALARQDVRDNNSKQAAATLAAAEKEIGDSPELRIARARLWAEMKEPDLAAKLTALAVGADKFSRTQQRRLLRELAGVAAVTGSDDLAGRLWDQLAGVQPHDLGVHLVRFDRALQAGNEAAALAIFQQVREVDGEAGSFTRLTRAVLLIWKAQTQKDTGGLAEAFQLLDGLGRERPRWGRVALGQALVHDLRGEAEALAKYQDAVEWGETSPQVLRRLVELLAAKGRFRDAEAVLQKLEDAATTSPDAHRIAAEVHLKSDNPKGALVAAAKAVSSDSKNPRDHLWLGQVYFAAGEKEKAEAPLRKAVELAPAASDGWLVLIRYLAATGRKEEAAKTLELARDKVEKGERPLFLALAYVQLGQSDKATEAFQQARAARPDDLRTVQAQAEFLFQSGKLPEAREAFQRVIGMGSASAEDKDFARRMLAVALAADRDYETSRKALEAIGLVGDGGRPAGIETPTQRRSRALVLALQRDRASKLEAIRLLEEDRNSLALSDQFLVAQLHLATGNKPQVRVTMVDLLRKPGATKVPLYLAFYAAWLLQEGDVREAEVWAKQLKDLQPDSLQTAELQARLFAAKKDLASARKVLLAKAEPAGAPVGALARVCEDIGLHDEAERLLKRFVEENKTTRPQTTLALAAFYGRRGRTADAIRVCEAVPATVPPPVVGDVAVNVLYATPSPAPAEVTTVAAWLEGAVAKAEGKTRAALVQQLASVRNLQGDYAAAADLYRRALADDPRDALTMNNLAFLLSARDGKHDDALRLLDQARRVIGPNPDLSDTEAIVRLKKGEIDAARKLLTEVLAVAPTAGGYFHLAQVEHKAERTIDARIAWRRAVELGLRRTTLHSLEGEAYDQLEKVLGGK